MNFNDKKQTLEMVDVCIEQPQDMLYPGSTPPVLTTPLATRIKRKLTTWEGWFGVYDYRALCMPRLPFISQKANESPFYGPNEPIAIFLALIMGVQHFLAVIGGILTPTILLSGAGPNNLNLGEETRQYMISASLIVSGLASLVQIIRFKIPKTRYYIGAGLLQIAGVAFANLPAAQALVSNMYKSGACPTEVLSDGSINYLPCPDAFGAVLGTQMISSLLTIGMSFFPPRVLNKLFPKIVTGVVLVIIGCSLLNTGMTNWAGGSGPCMSRPATGEYVLCPSIHAPNAQAWGSPVNFALGGSVFLTILVIEMIGSVFLKNVSVVVGLLVGCVVAGAVGMFDGSSITAAPAATFLWVKTFKLSVYGPGIIPYLFVNLDMAIECLGDLTGACDVSGLPLSGPEFSERCQGSLLADGLSGIFSGLATSMGVITFSQNNGVIAVTRCANRYAGIICALLLILFGVFGKIAAAFLAIPAPLIGGMTIFIFSSVGTSGIRILGYLDWTRRDRVIVAASLAIGLGVSVVPDWFNYVMPTSENSGLQGFYDAIHTVVSTGYLIGGILCILLNLILPYDKPDLQKTAASSDSVKIDGGSADHRAYMDEEAGSSPAYTA